MGAFYDMTGGRHVLRRTANGSAVKLLQGEQGEHSNSDTPDEGCIKQNT